MRLASPRPLDKSLGDSLAGSSPAQELGEGGGCQVIGRDRREQSTARPSRRSTFFVSWRKRACQRAAASVVLLRLLVSEKERELESLRFLRRAESFFGERIPTAYAS